jgi:glycosyltransferase involved in cell wall biosynthesis
MADLDITVLIPTYNRPSTVALAVAQFGANVRYELGHIHYLIGNDGAESLDEIAVLDDRVHIVPGPKRGLGANLNRLIETASTDLLFQMDDDHILTQPLDLNDAARRLNNEPRFGWVRYYMGECIEPDKHYKFAAQAWGDYWELLPYNELYVTSNRPHLKVRQFHTDYYGWYDESLPLGETEMAFCSRFIEKKRGLGDNGPSVFIPMYGLNKYQWAHIGMSNQIGKGLVVN